MYLAFCILQNKTEFGVSGAAGRISKVKVCSGFNIISRNRPPNQRQLDKVTAVVDSEDGSEKRAATVLRAVAGLVAQLGEPVQHVFVFETSSQLVNVLVAHREQALARQQERGGGTGWIRGADKAGAGAGGAGGGARVGRSGTPGAAEYNSSSSADNSPIDPTLLEKTSFHECCDFLAVLDHAKAQRKAQSPRSRKKPVVIYFATGRSLLLRGPVSLTEELGRFHIESVKRTRRGSVTFLDQVSVGPDAAGFLKHVNFANSPLMCGVLVPPPTLVGGAPGGLSGGPLAGSSRTSGDELKTASAESGVPRAGSRESYGTAQGSLESVTPRPDESVAMSLPSPREQPPAGSSSDSVSDLLSGGDRRQRDENRGGMKIVNKQNGRSARSRSPRAPGSSLIAETDIALLTAWCYDTSSAGTGAAGTGSVGTSSEARVARSLVRVSRTCGVLEYAELVSAFVVMEIG